MSYDASSMTTLVNARRQPCCPYPVLEFREAITLAMEKLPITQHRHGSAQLTGSDFRFEHRIDVICKLGHSAVVQKKFGAKNLYID